MIRDEIIRQKVWKPFNSNPALAILIYADWIPQVNGLPWALRSDFGDHICAAIVLPQIARPLLVFPLFVQQWLWCRLARRMPCILLSDRCLSLWMLSRPCRVSGAKQP
jgi:hypothetical protein